MTWINELPSRLRSSLNSLLGRVEQHETVYEKAENPSLGQVWVALAHVNERMDRIEDMVKAQRRALKESGLEVDRHMDRDLEESLKRY
ncbi:MAG: hypothetical protein ABEJ75_00585 [Candidatus Nanohaloarchaea archaeon]